MGHFNLIGALNGIVDEDVPPCDDALSRNKISDVEKTVVDENSGMIVRAEIVSVHVDFARYDS